MKKTITPEALLAAVTDGQELALIDVRERGSCARGRLLLSVNIPLSHFEFRIASFVPRDATRVILHDGGEGLAARAAEIMAQRGYTNVRVLEPGVSACSAVGFELFQHHYVFTYAFGLYVSQCYQTPAISPEDLKRKMDAGEDLVLLDTRQPPEFRHANIPGAVNVPTTELVYRVKDLAPDPKTQVFVNCGAITRGVLGGQTLREAGIENPMRVVDNGVRGWFLIGQTLASGAQSQPTPPSEFARNWSRQAAVAVQQQTPVPFVEPEQLKHWRGDPNRTLFVIDVRTEEEFNAGHLPGSRWILGSEIIGLYEDYIATRNARVCLVDDNEARAVVAASWLIRMGWPDVSVLKGGIGTGSLEKGGEVAPVVNPPTNVQETSIGELARWIETSEVLVLDFADSASYEQGHIPGAWWTIRSSLANNKAKLPGTVRVVTTSPDGVLAKFAAADLSTLMDIPVTALRGGTSAWTNEGRPLVTGLTRTLGEVDDLLPDVTVRASDDPDTAIACARRMVTWQEQLLEKIERDRSFSFPVLP